MAFLNRFHHSVAALALAAMTLLGAGGRSLAAGELDSSRSDRQTFGRDSGYRTEYRTEYRDDLRGDYGDDLRRDELDSRERIYRTNYTRPAQGDRFEPDYRELDRLLQERLQGGGYDEDLHDDHPQHDHRYGDWLHRDYGDRHRDEDLLGHENRRPLEPTYRDTPRYDLPRYETPRYETPRYETPRYETPRYETPRLETPRLETPRYDDRYEDRSDERYRPVTPAPVEPGVRPEDQLSESEQIQQRLTSRYGNPVVQRFVRTVSPQQAVNLFQEASGLIDSRHLEPTSYNDRVRQAAKNLMGAVRNPAFVQATGARPSADQVRQFESNLVRLVESRQVNDRNAAVQVIYQTAELARQVGIPQTAVVLEFVYGSAESLDKYSTFMPEDGSQPSAMRDTMRDTDRVALTGLEENIVGIGVEIKPHESGIEVVRPIRSGPAERAGVQKGDVIVGINGRSVVGQSLDFAVDLIGGPAGSSVTLNLLRGGRQLPPMQITRQQVRVYSVSEVEMVDSTVGYIKLEKFAQSSTEEVDQALWQLHKQGMQSLIIDVRGNPGGLLTTAIELSDKFLPGGTIVSTRGRTQQDQMTETAEYAQTWSVPLVVLIDENSASASEIFAAAIQENDRGLVVGRTSYGKGTVQTHFPLRSASGHLKLTTAKFYSPDGREMAGAGVTPDRIIQKSGYRPDELAADYDRDIEIATEIARSPQVREIAQLGGRTGQPGSGSGMGTGIGINWPGGR